MSTPLAKIAEGTGPAPAKFERWLRELFNAKQKRYLEDPEMFATYLTLAREACKTVNGHKACLTGQLELILADGVKQGAFEIADTTVTAQAIFTAVTRFHHPAHSDEWKDPQLPARIDALIALLLRGIEVRRR